ncbi:hypothetical protein ARHIZOSPH14_05140 [Agromyces rhizosphaerae]|uniref:Uncharacterized protein n=1 Tax=Agromyces rhizosphaerae TaxID=88374 RepID=A0A9W6CW06_9MICO|nr:hypothetical protein [Agromyces rhizosphaerae]GLI26272.1 hypothetical protein ARHIZOSPH14_05140 [Agromyces rhizosphaerae]
MTTSRTEHAAADSVLPYTRLLGLVIVPFLVVASVLLYVLPGSTDVTFSWTIVPAPSAMFLASAYIGGIWFFILVLRVGRWHRVRHGFPAVLVFATLAGLATFLHWDKFHFGHISFITWVVLYVTTPFLVLAAILLQRGQDPGSPEERDVAIPQGWRMLLVVVGLAATVTGAVLFVVPELLVDTWAWQLTPLTARIVGAVLTLPGMVNVWMIRDARWSAYRWVFQAQLVSLGAILLAIALASADLLWDRPAAWIVTGGFAFSFVAYLAFYLVFDRLARRAVAAGAS